MHYSGQSDMVPCFHYDIVMQDVMEFSIIFHQWGNVRHNIMKWKQAKHIEAEIAS